MSGAGKGIWKDGRRGAVSLTFDDGIVSQTDNAIPLLERYGFRGTFYLMARDDEAGRAMVQRFRAPHERGHEIGNHSVHHWCTSYAVADPAARGLEYRTLDEMREELDRADALLRAAFPGKDRWSFGYPCYNTFVGRGRGRASYVPLVAERFVAARAGGEMPTNVLSPHHADLHCLSSWKCEDRTPEELVGIVEQTVRQGGWSILTFHGVGAEYLTVALSAFETLLSHLRDSQERVWTAPLIEVAQHLAAWRAAAASR